MQLPPPDPAKMLTAWMDWERGEQTPGKTLADLKRAGLREVLERLATEQAEPDGAGAPAS